LDRVIDSEVNRLAAMSGNAAFFAPEI